MFVWFNLLSLFDLFVWVNLLYLFVEFIIWGTYFVFFGILKVISTYFRNIKKINKIHWQVVGKFYWQNSIVFLHTNALTLGLFPIGLFPKDYFQWIVSNGFYLMDCFQWLLFDGLFLVNYFQWLLFAGLFSMYYSLIC